MVPGLPPPSWVWVSLSPPPPMGMPPRPPPVGVGWGLVGWAWGGMCVWCNESI